ncbi:hypothetical protein BRC88_06915 [Halobacteriales archaeon QS_4_69_225]|nr:MAG: hypothetical protein BRC88_06915 [Halobacteriales archaeon QS_4_69_225]
MRRRRYLQVAGLTLAGGLAGCNDAGPVGTSEPTDAPTDTPTETPTPAEEKPSPTEDGQNDPETDAPSINPPLWMKLLPRKNLINESGDTTSTFARVDWKWYFQMRDTSPNWGPTSDEDWTFAPTRDNQKNPPSADILKTPAWGTVLAGLNTNAVVEYFPNLGPEIARQCGLTADEGEREETRIIDEVLTFANPTVALFIGADTDSVRDVLTDEQKLADGPPENYRGAGNAASRNIGISDYWPRGVVLVETGDEKSEDLRPAGKRLVDDGESAATIPSLRWAASAANVGSRYPAGAPVVTGEVNGSRFDFIGFGRSNRSVVRLEAFDTLVTTLEATRSTGTVQHSCSHVDGDPPTTDELRLSFETDSGEWTANSGAHVSSIGGSWN